jgi:hypothetical protein
MEPVNLSTHKSNRLLYADDLILISEKPSELQHCLNALEVYCEEWGLNINTKKTQIMIFSKNKNASTNEPAFNFTFNNSLLEKVNEYKYLGLIFNSNGKLNNASQNLAQKGRKAYFGFRSKIQFGNNLSVKNWLNLYDSIISPIMTYGSEIWISDFNIKLDNIHVFAF